MPSQVEENGEELSQDSVPAPPRTGHPPNTRGQTQHYISLHLLRGNGAKLFFNQSSFL